MATLSPSLPLENGHGINGTSYLSATTEINGNGTPTEATSATAVTAFDPELFKSYLLSLLPPIFGATREELEYTLFDDEFEDRVSKFAAEGGSVLYVQKVRDEAEGARAP